ncbi:MAG: helix-turn-helix transcriptional regulator, partial [Pseudomonadota bacterium]
LYPITTEGQVTGYMARAILMRLSPRVRAHLGDAYGFTKSELEILELVLRRFNLDQVAQLRGIKMNTVRTHVARLIQKLDCHSLVEAVSTAVEISTILAGDPPITTPAPDQHTQTQEARLVSLETPGHSMEYRRYGSPLGRPVLVLHSLEYGFAPSDEMIDAAHARGLSLIFPMRPGFGASTATNTLAEATRNVKEFIRVLGLKDISLIGLSLAAPLALAVQDKNPRIRETKLINYGLNVGDKLSQIRPRWIGGLLRMTLNSPASFMFGVRSMVSMIRTFGGLRFYRTLYRNQSADLDYLEQNADLFDRAADIMASADRTNVSIDLETAFLPNPDIEPLINRAAALEVISSADQHGVGPDDVKADAARLGVGFQHVSHTGRNWMFQNPNTLFDIMAAQ